MAPRKKKEAEAPPEPPRQQGRPSLFTQEIADEICERIADGDSLRAICRDDNMPRRTTVFRWLDADEQFRGQYARACEARESELFDQIIEIADTPQIGTKSVSKASGIEITEADMIEHRRLQVEARKWALGKMAPKKYGDKMQLTGDGGGPLETKSTLDVTGLSTAALAEIMKARDAAEPR